MLWLGLLGCGGDKYGNDAPSDVHSALTTTTDPGFSRCVARCSRGSDGEGCEAAGLQDACENYCVDPPPVPEECETFFSNYESCVARLDDWTCLGSPVVIGGLAAPVPVDPYECRLESDELEVCAAIPDPGCEPTLGGSGAACTAVATLCNAGGVTYSTDLLCDGVVCSMLVDSGGGPFEVPLPRADQLCDELAEKAALGPDHAARFLLAVSGLDPR
jgi:hypothetical protein